MHRPISPAASATLARLRIDDLHELAALSQHDVLRAAYASAGRGGRAVPVVPELRGMLADGGLDFVAHEPRARRPLDGAAPALARFAACGSFHATGRLRLGDPRFAGDAPDPDRQEAATFRVASGSTGAVRALDFVDLEVTPGTWDVYARRLPGAAGAVGPEVPFAALLPSRPIHLVARARGGPTALAMERIGELFVPDGIVAIADAAHAGSLGLFLAAEIGPHEHAVLSFVEVAVNDDRSPVDDGLGYGWTTFVDGRGRVVRVEVTAYLGEDPYGS